MKINKATKTDISNLTEAPVSNASNQYLVGLKILVGAIVLLCIWLYFFGTIWSLLLILILVFLMIYSLIQSLPLKSNKFSPIQFSTSLIIGFCIFPLFGGHTFLIKQRFMLELQVRQSNFESDIKKIMADGGTKKTKNWKSWNGSNSQLFLYEEGIAPPSEPTESDKNQCSKYATHLIGNFYLFATNCG